MRDVARKEGPRALMTGTAARVAAVAPGSAISFFVYESVKAYFLREDE
jgi:solute carrier family 25 citrate transporter 1